MRQYLVSVYDDSNANANSIFVTLQGGNFGNSVFSVIAVPDNTATPEPMPERKIRPHRKTKNGDGIWWEGAGLYFKVWSWHKVDPEREVVKQMCEDNPDKYAEFTEEDLE